VEEHDHLRWPFGAGSLLAPRGPDNEIEPTVVDVAPALEHASARTFRSSESSQFRSFSWAADDELAALFAVWLGEYAGEVSLASAAKSTSVRSPALSTTKRAKPEFSWM
jgi:hypothetical protein